VGGGGGGWVGVVLVFLLSIIKNNLDIVFDCGFENGLGISGTPGTFGANLRKAQDKFSILFC